MGKPSFAWGLLWPLAKTLRIEKKTIDILRLFVILQQFVIEAVPVEKKQGPAGQRCVHGNIKHMKHMYEAHV